jgi:outer membrane lipoprotein
MKTGFRWVFLLVFLFLLSGCAHVISNDLRKASDPSLTLRQVLENPSAFQGKTVVWGGEIIETLNQKDGSTQIEVFQKPLDWTDKPKETAASEGRFLIRVDSYLDSYLYRQGREITVAGEILGEKLKPLGEMDYRYPLLLSKQIYLWPEYSYPPYPSYYYYDPWWYYPRWYWGVGFYYHYHHHR